LTPFHFEADVGHASVTKQLILACCNVDLQTENGFMPLYYEDGKGHEAVTKQLLAACCNDRKTMDDRTAMQVAEQQGRAQITKLT
jgi:ankyrin repeat protein